MTTETSAATAAVVFCLGDSAAGESSPLLDPENSLEGGEQTEQTEHHIQIPEIVIFEPTPRQSLDSNASLPLCGSDTPQSDRQPPGKPPTRCQDISDSNNNADDSKDTMSMTTADSAADVRAKSEEAKVDVHKAPGTEEVKQNERGKKRLQRRQSELQTSAASEKRVQFRPARKFSLPAKLIDVEGDEERDYKIPDLRSLKHKNSIFGDLGVDEPWLGVGAGSETGLKNQLFSFFQASDNKLAMKLFGSKSALMKEKKRQFVEHSWIIHPCSNFRLYWDLLMLMFLVTNLIVLPVAIAFFYNDAGSHWLVFNITCDVLFALDIVINFRTGLIDHKSHGEIILDGKEIARRYLRSWFAVDFLSSLPLDYIFLALEEHLYTAGRAIKILRLAKILQLLRLLRISRLVRYIKIWQEYFSLASIVVRICNLISIMVLLSHWSGCIQFAVPVFQGLPEDSWIVTEHLEEAHWWEQYSKSLFKALSHMLCIGYGQFPPKNTTETWLTIASMLSGATCYALFIGHATALIQSFDTSSRQFRDHLQQVNEYMSFRKLPPDLRQRITAYYNHRYGGKMFDEHMILAELSETLRNDIIYHNCQELIETVPFFVNADPNFVNAVVTRLEFEMFQPGDVVIKALTPGDKMYFIQEGVVEILDDNGQIVTRLSDGSYFGEISLLTGRNRTAAIRAATICHLFSLTKEHFDHILTCYPVMKRTLETIAAQRLDHLGKDPTLVTSRESLLEDMTGFKEVMKVASEAEIVDESTTNDSGAERNSQFLTAVKGFFTQDSESFTKRTGSYRVSPQSPERSELRLGANNNSNIKRCKSTANHMTLTKSPTTPISRRVQSSLDLAPCQQTQLWDQGQSLEKPFGNYRKNAASSNHLHVTGAQANGADKS